MGRLSYLRIKSEDLPFAVEEALSGLRGWKSVILI